jgi:hypothetical protein
VSAHVSAFEVAGPGDGLAMLYTAVADEAASDLATGQAETIAQKNVRDAEYKAQEDAIAREEQAQESSSFWGDVEGAFEGVAEVAVPAGVVLTAAAPPAGAAVLAVGAVATAAGGGAHVVAAVDEHTADEARADATAARHAMDRAERATGVLLEDLKETSESRRRRETTLAGAMQTRDETLVASASIQVRA